jgi:hypothetical protein
VQGRITERHLAEANKLFPGIAELYWGMDSKPATFLQLLWIYQGLEAVPAEAGHSAAAGR